tara:strand:- start:47379 stop:47651 length:273 start_codon:yes stop_codon:yes gene_type:complete
MRTLDKTHKEDSVILEENGEVRDISTLELYGHWFKQDDVIYFMPIGGETTLTCSACGKAAAQKDILKIWTSVPFLQEKKKQYYCGCMGWD